MELLFYMIGDVSIKHIVKFVISLISFLKKKKYQLFKKMLYFYKILGFLQKEMRPFFNREFFMLLLGLRPRLWASPVNGAYVRDS